MKRQALILAIIGLVSGFGGVPRAAADIKMVEPVGPAWVIDSAGYTGSVQDPIVRLKGVYDIRLLRNGRVQVPLAIGQATVTDVAIQSKAGEAHIVPMGSAYALLAEKKGRYQVQVTFNALLVQQEGYEGLLIGIPQAAFSKLELSVPRKELELRPQDLLYAETYADAKGQTQSVTARLGAQPVIDLRWRTKPAAAAVVEPVLTGEVQSVWLFEDGVARMNSLIAYRSLQGETRRLVMRVPASLEVLAVRGGGIDEWHLEGSGNDRQLIVNLAYAIKGEAYPLFIEAEQALAPDAAAHSVPAIALVGVKQERGTIAISRAGSLEVSAEATEGITRVDVRELPAEMLASPGGSAVMAIRYHQQPYQLSLALERHEDHPVLAAIAEQGDLTTVISSQGGLLTRAAYWVRSNKKQFLSVALPEGASLWSCLVGGESVKPVKGEGEQLLIPLKTDAALQQSQTVELVYFQKAGEPERFGHLALQGPVLDVPTTVANWTVYTPKRMCVLRANGNVQPGAFAPVFVEEAFAAEAVGGQAGDLRDRFDKNQLLKSVSQSVSVTAYSPEVEESDSRANEKRQFREQLQAADLADPQSMPAPAAPRASKDEWLGVLGGRLRETGILPLKIRLPNAGSVHHFSRLMATSEPLAVRLTFVKTLW